MMSVRNLSGALIPVQPMMRNPSNALVPVVFGVRDTEGAPIVTQPPVSSVAVTASPSDVNGAASRPGLATVATNETTATATGGTAPYTFFWQSQDGAMSPTAATSATTRFTGQIEGGDTVSDLFTCTATDAKGQVATAQVYASVSNFGKSLNAPIQ